MNIRSLVRELACAICKATGGEGNTVEEIVAASSAGMSDTEKAHYWYELSQNVFALLGKVDIDRVELSVADFLSVAQAEYPTLTDIKIAESVFFTTSLKSLEQILSRDWTNLVPYELPVSKCDKYGVRLYNHLVDYYGITAVVPVWGDTDRGYHGFNLAVLQGDTGWIARLIEPQTDQIFAHQGPLGRYVPRLTALELGIKRMAPV